MKSIQIILIFSFIPFFCNAQSDKELLYEEARSYLDAEEYQLALEVLTELTKEHPDFDTAWVEQGYAYLGLRQPAQAIIVLDTAIRIDSNNLGAFFVRAIAHTEMDNYKAALIDYNYIVLSGKSDYYHLALKERAILYLYYGNTSNALDDFMLLNENEPDDIETLVGIGTIYIENNDLKTGVSFFNKALEVDPNNVNALHKRARVYYKKKQYKKALDDMDKSIILDAGIHDLYVTRASIYVALGNTDYALADLDYAIMLNPNEGKLYYERAKIKEYVKDKKGAKSDYKKASSLGYIP